MQSTTERRLSILENLCERRYDTVANLAEEFGVTQRTISNDIFVLSCSYPIYTQQGNGGGVYVTEGFRLGKKYLTQEQADLLERLAKSLVGEDKVALQAILHNFRMPQMEVKHG